jgi:hypothetical protein
MLVDITFEASWILLIMLTRLMPCCALPSWLAGLILFSNLHDQLRSSALKVFDARQINWRGSVR